jgi:uncharacterized protein with HEPN domain
VPREPYVYLEEIVTACDRVLEYTTALGYEDFEKSQLVIDAVLRNLEVIGEAAKNIPDSVRGRAPEIEWSRVAGLRDILAHQYFAVKLETVWNIVQTKISSLRIAALRLISELEASSS